ncbi:MAG: hypothetical protein A2017_10445 [Lentisphaerae bacterium GWF2_44_16]|nr:MAG: hypothetical protein A2017_10445 [Lentisphaerae bacterium GWF2_44_16]
MPKKENRGTKEIKLLQERISEALASINVLFPPGLDQGKEIIETERKEFLCLLLNALNAMNADLSLIEDNVQSAIRRRKMFSREPDSIDCINMLADFCENNPFSENMESIIIEMLSSKYDFEHLKKAEATDDNLLFFMGHSSRLCHTAGSVIRDFLDLLDALDGKASGLTRIRPDARGLFMCGNTFDFNDCSLDEKTINSLREKSVRHDIFKSGKAFRYINGEFYKSELNSIRPADRFFGYEQARINFRRHFEAFSQGKNNLPLLITSLPGLGKTHFTISHTFLFPELTLILPEPSDLERQLEALIRKLAARKNHKFVLFFDDVNTGKIDWYYFRTNVGGSFALPGNITIVIASNFEFPANISSRGRVFVFPMFDEIKCQEMIFDYLLFMGMKKPSSELVSVIAADYVEAFGQKLFEELSPRTLIRYLEKYENDPAKRKRVLELSRDQVIARPDSQIFFEVNVKLMKSLYGESAIEELRKRELKK